MTNQVPSANRLPAWLHTLACRQRQNAARYLQLDARSLGLTRIYLAVLLLVDLLWRAKNLSTWYSNDGLLPNHTLLWSPPGEPQISFFFTASTTGQAAVLFVVCGVVYLLFLLGYRTRLFHLLSLLALYSLQGRLLLFEDGSEVTLRLLATWTVFLPMGARFSIDAMRARLAGTKEVRPESLADRNRFAPPIAPATSLVVAAILLQVASIYLFNVLHKSGDTWKEGSAFHYVLHQDRIVTQLGYWVRPYVTASWSRLVSWAAVAMEASLVLLVLSPFKWKLSRRLGIGVAVALHLGFAAFLNLGLFSFNMIGFFLLLLTDRDWQLLTRWLGPSPKRARVVYIDASCGVCFALTRLLARLDVLGRLTIRANDQPERPADLSDELIARTIVVDDPTRQKRWIKAAAFAEIFLALPALAPLGWLLKLPLLKHVADVVYDAFARNRTTISLALGMDACGLPGAPKPSSSAKPAPLPIVETLAEASANLRELAVVILLIACFLQSAAENRAMPHWLRLPQPSLFKAIVLYPRLMQGWGMFAPNAPTHDHNVVVEATTATGVVIDPLALASARVAPAPTNEVSPFQDVDEFFADYVSAIPWRREYFSPFEHWILNHHERVGRLDERVVAFKVFLIEDESPPVGQSQPRTVKKTLLFEGPAR